MITIKVTPRKKCLGTVGYAKEHNYTQLHIQIDKRIQGCSVYDAEFSMANEEKFLLHDLEIKDNEYVVVPLKDIVLVQGKLEIQIVGHQAESDVVVKSCVYNGIVAESVNAFADAILEENPTLLEQLYDDVVWIKENLGNIEINIEIDDKVTEGSDNLITSGAVFEAIKEIEIPEGGSTEIPDNSISTEKIKDRAVTPEKLDREYLTEHQSLEGYATEKYVDDKIEEIKNDTPIEIPDNSIGTQKIKDLNVTREKIADRAINAEKIAELAITKEKIRPQAVTTDKIAQKAVTRSKLADDIDLTPSLIKEEIKILEDYKNYDVYSVIKADEKIPKDWKNVKFWGKEDGLKVPESLEPYDFDFSQISETNYIEIKELPELINFDSVEGQDIAVQLVFLDEEAKKYIQFLLLQNSIMGTYFQISVYENDSEKMRALNYIKDVGWSSSEFFQLVSNLIIGNYNSMKILNYASFTDELSQVLPEGFIAGNFETSPEILINILLKDIMSVYNLPGYYISYRAPGTAQLDPVQSDYDINDEEDLRYIQNRPFYDSRKFEDIIGTEILDTATNSGLESASVSIVKVANLPDTPKAIADEIEYIQGVSNTYTTYNDIGNASCDFGGAWLIDESDTSLRIETVRCGITIFYLPGFYVLKPDSVELGECKIKTKGGLKYIDNKFIEDGSIAPEKLSQNYATEEYVNEKLDDIAAIGGQVQTDYEENDINKITYIKNRPFYKEIVYEEPFIIPSYTGNEVSTNEIEHPTGQKSKYIKISNLNIDHKTFIEALSKITQRGYGTSHNIETKKYEENLSLAWAAGLFLHVIAVGKPTERTLIYTNDLGETYSLTTVYPESGIYLGLPYNMSNGQWANNFKESELIFEPYIKKIEQEFLPDIAYIYDSEVKENSKNAVTSEAVFKAISSIEFPEMPETPDSSEIPDGSITPAKLDREYTEKDDFDENIDALYIEINSFYDIDGQGTPLFIYNPIVTPEDKDKLLCVDENGEWIAKDISDDYASKEYVDTKIGDIKIPNSLSELTDDAEHRTVTDAEKEAWNAKSEKGEKGDDGQDGISATHEWNGTVLTITSASGTSSANLKGEIGPKGDTGEVGPQGPKGDNGDKGETGLQGEKGADGYTPIKGTDYFTEEDKQEIIDDIIAELPEYATKDEVNQLLDSFATLLDSINREVL